MTLAARIRRLSVAFHERTILHDITLDIPAEGITVLLGRSGSGKTTFLRALNRLNECLPGCRTSGEAELRLGGGLRPIYAGRTGEAALSDLRRRVGMVFQTPNILPASIRQNMLLPLQLATAFPASEWRERMERSLTEVGLWHDVSSRLREPASILSGGQQQRLCLALSAPLLQPVASTIQKNAHPNGCAFLHCLLASLYHWSIHSRKSACPVSLALSPARLVSSRRRRGSIAARANSQACPTNHLSSLSASTSG